MKRQWARYLLMIPLFLLIPVALSATSNLFFPRSSKLVDRLSAEEKARAAEAIHCAVLSAAAGRGGDAAGVHGAYRRAVGGVDDDV